MKIVVDINVFIGASLGSGASNSLVQLCLKGTFTAVLGNALFAEYEDVLGREAVVIWEYKSTSYLRHRFY